MQKDKKSKYKAAFYAALFLSSLFLGIFSASPKLPSLQRPLIFYSNDSGDDLKLTFLHAISQAKSSIFLIIYGLTDLDIIQALQKKIQEGIPTKIFYDPNGSKHLETLLPSNHIYPLKARGIMHKKILILDNARVFIGSANLTETSLRLHNNLVMGCYDPPMANFFINSLDSHYKATLDEHSIDLFSLPEHEQKAFNKLLEKISEAKNEILICMFTFTHPKIADALITAHQKGVNVHIAIDPYSYKGASNQTIDRLKKENISITQGKKGKLLHHKWCLIDNRTLILGSTNWTQSAFSKNEDTLCYVDNLNKKNLKMIRSIWKKIHTNDL